MPGRRFFAVIALFVPILPWRANGTEVADQSIEPEPRQVVSFDPDIAVLREECKGEWGKTSRAFIAFQELANQRGWLGDDYGKNCWRLRSGRCFPLDASRDYQTVIALSGSTYEVAGTSWQELLLLDCHGHLLDRTRCSVNMVLQVGLIPSREGLLFAINFWTLHAWHNIEYELLANGRKIELSKAIRDEDIDKLAEKCLTLCYWTVRNSKFVLLSPRPETEKNER